MYFSTALLQETTSCINGNPKNLEADIAPEPVNAIVKVLSGYFLGNFANTLHTVFFVSEKCLSYSEYISFLFESNTIIFTVVEPTSRPIWSVSFIKISPFKKCIFSTIYAQILYTEKGKMSNLKG